MCNAALGFDPERGTKFGTYAHFKVRGAIIDDFLRKQTDVGHTHRTPCSAIGELEDADEPIDASPSAEDVLIEQQEQRRKCRHIAFAGKSVGVIEFRAVTKKHMRGESLREIGAAEGRSASWAHYRVHCGERQLKEALLDPAANDA
jgi:DNA-directed RNA polymerase specialized sigma subunit